MFDGPKGTFQEDGLTPITNITYGASASDLSYPCILGMMYCDSGRPSSSVATHTYYTYGGGTCKSVRLKQFRIYESTANETGALIHHMYPVKNISTGEGALYDVVTETLYTSTKPAELEVGPEV